MNNKPIYVTFGEKKIENEFEILKEGKFEDKQLYEFIDRAIKDLKSSPTCGTKIPKKLWPKEYIKKFGITNLWKYDMPNAWRLIYTIQTNEIMILNNKIPLMFHKWFIRNNKLHGILCAQKLPVN